MSLAGRVEPDAAAVLAKHNSYIAAFNRADIDTITECLHPDLKITMGGSVVASGREGILQSYRDDFVTGKKVTEPVAARVVREGEEGFKADAAATIDVTLSALGPGEKEPQVIRVFYHYNSELVQTQHDIIVLP